MGLTNTSIKVDEEKWKRLKIWAIQNDRDVSEALGMAIDILLNPKAVGAQK